METQVKKIQGMDHSMRKRAHNHRGLMGRKSQMSHCAMDVIVVSTGGQPLLLFCVVQHGDESFHQKPVYTADRAKCCMPFSTLRKIVLPTM